MAGAILIGEKTGLSTSGIEFDNLLDAIRPLLTDVYPVMAQEVFNPHDEGGMNFISIQDLSPNDFKIFQKIVRIAFEQDQQNSLNNQFINSWQEFIQLLSMDQRSHQ